MKKCVKCGRELPDEASFCVFCEKEQIDAVSARPPRIWKRKALTALITAAVLIAAAAVLYFTLRPHVFDAHGPELDYRGYHVLLSFSMKNEPHPADEQRTSTIPSHTDYAYPSQLYAYREDDTVNAGEDFMQLVSRVSVSTSPRDGAAQMEYDEPEHDEAFPDAARVSNIYYDSTCGTNDIIWTLYMKNGDRLILRQMITVKEQSEKNYYSKDYDMSDMEALKKLLTEIEASVEPGTLVSIYLPPVIYEGSLVLSERGYYFYGSSDGTVTTTFTGTVTVETETPQNSEFIGITFTGKGGTGVFATRSAVLRQCVFTGWDTGAVASNGAWINVLGCRFSGNGIGLQYNTATSRLKGSEIADCIFEENAIGVHFAQVPPEIHAMEFTDSVFKNNGTNVKNDASITVIPADAALG